MVQLQEHHEILLQIGRPNERILHMPDTALDATDLKILNALQHDASLSRKKLAQLCHMSEATCSRRIASLKKRGFMDKTHLALNPRKFGLALTVFVLVTLENENPAGMKRFTDRLRKHPEVLGVHYISGEYDYLLHLVARDMAHYQQFVDEYLAHETQIKRFLSLFQMKEIKYTSALPLGQNPHA